VCFFVCFFKDLQFIGRMMIIINMRSSNTAAAEEEELVLNVRVTYLVSV
jgi:hypothetical protein